MSVSDNTAAERYPLMPRIERDKVAAIAIGLGSIDGLSEVAVGCPDEYVAKTLARRFSYFFLKPVDSRDVTAVLMGDGGSGALSLENNRRGLTVIECIDQVSAVMKSIFGHMVDSVPVSALLRYATLSETKEWHRADGFDPIELFAWVERASGARELESRNRGFACECPILEMGHALFLYDDLNSKRTHSHHIAHAMEWPQCCPKDSELLIDLVLECMAVIIGLPFDQCRRSIPLAEILSYSIRPSKYYGLKQRVAGLVSALTWLWSSSGLRKARLLMRTCEECMHRGEDVANWVRLWA